MSILNRITVYFLSSGVRFEFLTFDWVAEEGLENVQFLLAK